MDDLTRGPDLTGALPRSGVFSQKFRPASMTCEDLRKVSELSRSVIIESLQSSGDTELDRGLFEATMKEVEKGFLEGPVCRSYLPPGSTLTKCFPVEQKNKVRPIDDYKASLVNFAVTQNEGVTIHTIDHIASMTACWMKSGHLSLEDPLVANCWIFPMPTSKYHSLTMLLNSTRTLLCMTRPPRTQKFSNRGCSLLVPLPQSQPSSEFL